MKEVEKRRKGEREFQAERTSCAKIKGLKNHNIVLGV